MGRVATCPGRTKVEVWKSAGQQGRERRGGVQLPGPEGRDVQDLGSDSWPHGMLALEEIL